MEDCKIGLFSSVYQDGITYYITRISEEGVFYKTQIGEAEQKETVLEGEYVLVGGGLTS